MATHTSAVTASASLTCSVLNAPQVGMSTTVGLMFTDGDSASDNYVLVGTGATALNADIVGNGYLLVQNPTTNGALSILCASQAMGPIQPGGCALLPLASGTVYNATLTAAANVGVTVIECHANA